MRVWGEEDVHGSQLVTRWSEFEGGKETIAGAMRVGRWSEKGAPITQVIESGRTNAVRERIKCESVGEKNGGEKRKIAGKIPNKGRGRRTVRWKGERKDRPVRGQRGKIFQWRPWEGTGRG